MGGENLNVPGVRGCKAPCVEHLRFATDQIGYAFGPGAFFMTTDGGRSWQRQPGGAIAVETADQNVVRVTSSGTGCPAWCDIKVETAPMGTTVWTTVSLPSPVGGDGFAFDRQGADVYLLSLGSPAGGTDSARSTLFRSIDDGATWQQLKEPCPQVGREVDSTAIGAGAAGRASVICYVRGTDRWFAATSTDNGASFTRGGDLPIGTVDGITGDPATVLAVRGRQGLRVSHDRGRTWHRIDEPFGPVTFAGFESTTVGRVIANGGRTIWTTYDAGRTWHRAILR
jgi:photosystem II stability/assembly factor-like uncharacterized protein